MTDDDHTALLAEIDRLRRREREWHDRAAAVADWYWQADADGQFTAISEEAREFGIDPTRLIGLDRLTAEDDACNVAQRRALLAGQMPFRDLIFDYNWEGYPLVVALHGVPVHDAAGVLCGYRGCARDMTGAEAARVPEPVLRPPNRPREPVAIPMPPTAAIIAADSTHRRLDILAVDDDAVNRLVIGGFLTPHGHTVSFAHDGEQGVALARDHRFDLILMDVMMPGLDGPSATRMIRALPPPSCDVPIIALTANAMPGDRERYLAEEMTDYVTKPIDRGRLFGTIERVIGGRAFAPLAERQAAVSTPDTKQTALLDALTDSLDL
jgi:CheY-like chemotaxis protein